MKKNFLIILLGGLMMMPAKLLACPDDGDESDDKPDVWRGPVKYPHAYISYNEESGLAFVHFLSAVNDATIVVYLNGIEIDGQLVEAVEGMQIPLYLPVYGCGEFTIQVKSGSILLTTYCVTF